MLYFTRINTHICYTCHGVCSLVRSGINNEKKENPSDTLTDTQLETIPMKVRLILMGFDYKPPSKHNSVGVFFSFLLNVYAFFSSFELSAAKRNYSHQVGPQEFLQPIRTLSFEQRSNKVFSLYLVLVLPPQKKKNILCMPSSNLLHSILYRRMLID